MLFTGLIILLTILYLIILELSKNIILGWVIGVLAAVAAILTRSSLTKKGQLNLRTQLIIWGAFIGILCINYLQVTGVVYVSSLDAN